MKGIMEHLSLKLLKQKRLGFRSVCQVFFFQMVTGVAFIFLYAPFKIVFNSKLTICDNTKLPFDKESNLVYSWGSGSPITTYR